MAKYLDENGLLYFWGKIKAYVASAIEALNLGTTYATKSEIPTKLSQLTNDSGYTKNVGTITGITMNGSSKGTSGVVDLGTVVTDVSGKANTSDLATVATTGAYADLIGTPTIPTVPTNVSDFTNDAGYLVASDISGKANLASPTFTGTPKAPTAAKGTNTTQIATTAFVKTALGDYYTKTETYTKTEVDTAVSSVSSRLDTLIGGAEAAGAIDTFNEIKEFLTGVSGTTLQDMIDGVTTNIENKGYVLSTDLVAITNAEIDRICV